MKKRGKLIVLSGPSGVGKTTICEKILEKRKDIRYSISATSRPKRKNEKNHREYIFLSENEFKSWIRRGLFIEYAVVHGNLYGTPKNFLEDTLNNGLHVLMDVDVQGAQKLMKLYPDGLYFFIIPPDIVELERRLKERDTDKYDVIKSRLTTALKELKYKDDYKHVIENRDLTETIKKINMVIEKELDS